LFTCSFAAAAAAAAPTTTTTTITGLVASHSGNAFHSINKVTVRRAGLVLRWVTACGQVNHLGM